MAHGAASVEAKSLSVGAVLELRHPFAVPRYQRAYAWDDEAVGDFVADIENLLGAPSAEVSHFFGGLVCIERTDNQLVRPHSYEIVDGQQRLATFVLALSCVVQEANELEQRSLASRNLPAAHSARTLADDTPERFVSYKEADVAEGTTRIRPRLTLSLADNPVFQQLLDGLTPTPTRESHQLLVDAHAALNSMARRQVGTTGPLSRRVTRLLRLRQALVEDSHVVHIVSTERAQAYRLFSVLNDRGTSLSDADLLRSRTLELLETHPTEQEQVAKLWDEMLDARAKHVDAFFRALYPSFTGKRATGDLFDGTVAHFLPPSAPTTATEAHGVVRVVEMFRDELTVFLKLVDGAWPYDRSPGAPTPVRAWQVDRLGRLVLTLKHELALPVLLAGARKLPEKTFAELVYMLEIFAFRYKNICNGHAGPPAILYYAQAKMMRDATATSPYTLTSFRISLRELIINSANDARFREFLEEKLRYSNSSQRANIREFLTTLEDHDQWLRATPVTSSARPRPSMSKVIDIGDASLEHIYPQNAKGSDRDSVLEPMKHYLGNLTFFGQSDNVSAGNKSFAEKKASDYAGSSVALTTTLSKLAQWTDAEFTQRTKDLLDAAIRIFVV